MKVVFANEQLLHRPQTMYATGAIHPHPEVPERASRLLTAARDCGLSLEPPADHGLEFVHSVHSRRYVDYLQNIFSRWSRIDGSAAEVVPGIQPGRRDPDRDSGYPASAAGQAGFHHIDLSSPVGPDTWAGALWSSHTAAHAALKVAEGQKACYALSRPPGHHAGKEYAAGFCYFANAAVAAEVLRRKHERVAVLDVDVHHGNGTQDIFYARPDVLTVSIHADPVRFYPFFWGYADETGDGEGQGANLNLPLARGTTDDDYLRELGTALTAIERFDAGALIVALGLDAHESDPMRGFGITTAGFSRIGRRIGELGLPTVLVQEGGYLSDQLGLSLRAFLEGFMQRHGN